MFANAAASIVGRSTGHDCQFVRRADRFGAATIPFHVQEGAALKPKLRSLWEDKKIIFLENGQSDWFRQ